MRRKLMLDEADLVEVSCWELSDKQIELFFKVMNNHGLILLRGTELRNRLETLKSDAVKYKDCEFNAPKVRRGMILQLEEILKE